MAFKNNAPRSNIISALYSFLTTLKNIVFGLQRVEMLKVVIVLNIIYYTSFFLVAFYGFEWPNKRLYVVSNKQLAICASIIIDIVTYVVWSFSVYLFARLFKTSHKLSLIVQAVFSLNVVSLFTLLINTIFFFYGLKMLDYTILLFDLIVKIFLLYNLLIKNTSENHGRIKVSLIVACSVIIMFLVSSVYYLLPYEKYEAGEVKISDEMRIDSKKYLKIKCIISYKARQPDDVADEMRPYYRELIERHYFPALYEVLIKAVVTFNDLKQLEDFLSDKIKRRLNSELNTNAFRMQIINIKMDIAEEEKAIEQ